MKKIFLSIILLILLSACAPSQSQLSTAIALTEAAKPSPTLTPTPTQIPLADIKLESLLVLEGDLPPGVSGSQIRADPPRMFEDVPEPAVQIYQAFEKGGEQSGGVTVFLYNEPSGVQAGYDSILEGMGEPDDVGIGKLSASTSLHLFGTDETMTDLLWMRCRYVVHIRIGSNRDGAVAYAQRLDRRLETAICL